VTACPDLVLERFQAKWRADPHTGCWIWVGTRRGDGYGLFTSEGRPVRAHRFSYEKAKGPIAAGLVIDHLCERHSCVNPDHLQAVPPSVNFERGGMGELVRMRRKKTHCAHGHALEGANLRMRGNGTRACMACDRDAARRSRERASA
jgi:hypothetical protein